MSRDTRRRRAGELLARQPHAQKPGNGATGDELLGAASAWIARVTPRGHVFFVGRHRHLLALTDQRLVAWRHPRRDDVPTLDVPLRMVSLRAEHPSKPFFQLLVELEGDTLVVELRHRDHAFGRALKRALGTVDAASLTG